MAHRPLKFLQPSGSCDLKRNSQQLIHTTRTLDTKISWSIIDERSCN